MGYRLSLLPFSFLTLCRLLWWEERVKEVGARNSTSPSAVPILAGEKKNKKKSWGCFPRGHRGRPNINYTFVHLWLTLDWPWLTPEWKRSSKPSPLPQPIPCCQQNAHGPLTHCQPNETSALMKPLWALLVRRQRAMKTLTIHFMDWSGVRTDNTGLINGTGLLSWRNRRGNKSATGDSIEGKSKGLVSCWWWGGVSSPQGQKTNLYHIRFPSGL